MSERELVAGIHAVRHALEAGELAAIWFAKDMRNRRLDALMRLAKTHGLRCAFVPREALARMVGSVAHQGVVGRLRRGEGRVMPEFSAWLEGLDIAASPLLLVLDQVTDPHNLGACLRTAEAAGCAAVIVPKDHAADIHSPVVAKAACGALARIPIVRVVNLRQAIERLKRKRCWVVGLAGEAERSLYDVSLRGALAMVLGSEGKGLRPLVARSCDECVHIPMAGRVESLNVSVATGVALFEAVRQRMR